MAGRSMTAGEKNLAREIFLNQIDFEKVTVYNRRHNPFQPSDRAMAPNGNIYYAPSDPGYSSDFASADIHKQATFIHELVHVWQHQQGINVTFRGIFERNYEYLPITSSTNFRGLKIEQQGNLVRDYFYLTRNYSNDAWPDIRVYRDVIPWLSNS